MRAAFEAVADRRCDDRHIVGDERDPANHRSALREQTGDDLRARVADLTAQQVVADDDDLGIEVPTVRGMDLGCGLAARLWIAHCQGNLTPHGAAAL